MYQGVMDIEHLRSGTARTVVEENLIRKKRRNEVGEMFGEGLKFFGIAYRQDHIHAELIDQVFRLFLSVNNNNWIEGAAPKCERKADCCAEGIQISRTNRPANSEWTIGDFDSSGFH